MSNSYQHNIPAARVNITLDVETGGAKSKKELPMKLLMIGDYSNHQATGSLAERERIMVNKYNINQVMSTIGPKASFLVSNKTTPTDNELQICLKFQTLEDFSPQGIVDQVPQLQRLKAMRNLLKDLKSNVLDNQLFRKELELILKQSSKARQLLQELAEHSPIESIDDVD